MFENKMVTPAIPERVYVLCKTIHDAKGQHIKKEDLKNTMEPSFVNNSSVYFNDYFRAAEELGLISAIDQTITLSVDWNDIASMYLLRRYVNSKLKNFSTGQFYRVTKAFFEMGKNVFAISKNIADDSWRSLFNKNYGLVVDAPGMRAWRFWFSFLGFGYMQDMFPIPNASVFIKDLIVNSKLELSKKYIFDDFMSKMQPDINIITNTMNRELSFGVSCGLRTLHDAGHITLESVMDQSTDWVLDAMDLHLISRNVSYITIND